MRFNQFYRIQVDQNILQKFIEEGYFERHLNKTRALYKNRHDILLSCLKEIDADFTVSGENAGVHLLLHFHNGKTEEELIQSAAEKSVKVYGLSAYYVGRNIADKKQEDSVILLGYANMGEESIRRAGSPSGGGLERIKKGVPVHSFYCSYSALSDSPSPFLLRDTYPRSEAGFRSASRQNLHLQ